MISGLYFNKTVARASITVPSRHSMKEELPERLKDMLREQGHNPDTAILVTGLRRDGIAGETWMLVAEGDDAYETLKAKAVGGRVACA